MSLYTYAPAAVLDEQSGQLATGATGKLRSSADQSIVPVFDVNGSPIPEIRVGPRGVYHAFRAEVPDGLLDFGSVLIPVVSQESLRSGLEAISIAQDAVDRAGAAAQAAQEAAESVAQMESVFIVHGGDANVARPDRDVALVWIGHVRPANADPSRDQWLASTPLQVVPPV